MRPVRSAMSACLKMRGGAGQGLRRSILTQGGELPEPLASRWRPGTIAGLDAPAHQGHSDKQRPDAGRIAG